MPGSRLVDESFMKEAIAVVAEPDAVYDSEPEPSVATGNWVEVLVDCPGAQGIYTYWSPPELAVQAGDILSVPFGAQQVGAIALGRLSQLPPELATTPLRSVESVVNRAFFPSYYWTLLRRVADYYATSLMQVVRVALPPGLLARSQRRIRLLQACPEVPLVPAASQLLAVLQASKTGDYSWQFLQRQVFAARQGLAVLLAAGMVESYLAPPETVRPKQRRMVSLTGQAWPAELTDRQREVLGVLKRQGGEMSLAELVRECRTTSAMLHGLAQKGVLVVRNQEVLRLEAGSEVMPDQPQLLTSDQAAAVTQIHQTKGFAPLLLHGVTGSGKTEVYLQAIAPVLQRGESALVLVPEIGLTPQLTDRFRARFGAQVCAYHSALSEGERYDTWRQMLTGQAQVVIGTRSAIFAPLPRLGMIVLDEEHDASFKQDQPVPCYHARTVALWRAELAACPVILGSATPALETWLAAQPVADTLARLQYLHLPARVHDRPLPVITVVDMRQELQRGNPSLFSQTLQMALRSLQAQSQQGILFVPRRGHSTFVSCRSCGYVQICPHCDVSLTYHQPHPGGMATLHCHYCNYNQAPIPRCPVCDSPYFKHFGTGTQRVVQALEQTCPELGVLRFDRDTTRGKGAHRDLLEQFAQGEADVLVGTQMLTKGIDLPQVTLVGILAADGLLHRSDYRASERAFQVLTQVAGRCGRGEDPGQVILQTYSPDHPVIEAVQQHTYADFATGEMRQRQELAYPPWGRLVLLRLSSLNSIAVQQAAQTLAATLQAVIPSDWQLLGPAPAEIPRLGNRYRWQLLLKVPLAQAIALDWSALQAHCPTTVNLIIDVDPLTV